MILYRSIVKEVLKYSSIALGVIVLLHMAITLIISNVLFYSSITMFTLCAVSLLAIVALVTSVLRSAKYTTKLYLILEDKCDPLKVLDLIEGYIIDSMTNKSLINLNLIKFTCYFRAGLYKEAKFLLDSFRIEKETTKKDTIILWNHNKIMLGIASYDDSLEEDKVDFIKLKEKYPNKSDIISMYVSVQQKYSDLFNINLDNLDKYYLEALSESSSLIEKVCYSNNLAKIYYRQNKYDDAMKYAEYVVANANTLHAMTESNNIISKITGKE